MPSLFAHEPASVLLVEDTLDDEMLALRALRSCGRPLAVRVARDGRCARRMLGLNGEPGSPASPAPRLVVSDLKLPGLDGYELLCRARAERRLADVPYLIFSSSNEASDVERCLRCGADAYLQKPVGFDEYVGCLQETVRWALGGFDPDRLPECVVTRHERRELGRVG